MDLNKLHSEYKVAERELEKLREKNARKVIKHIVENLTQHSTIEKMESLHLLITPHFHHDSFVISLHQPYPDKECKEWTVETEIAKYLITSKEVEIGDIEAINAALS